MNLSELTEKLSLVSEIYAKRFNIDRTSDWHLLKLQEEVGELSAAFLKISGRGRTGASTAEELRKNLQDEISDVLAMTLLFAKNQGIDPDKSFREKWFKYLETSHE